MNSYKGSIPEGGANLWPKYDPEGETTGVPGQGGQGRINPTKDESDKTGGYKTSDFLTDSNYWTGPDFEEREGGMKTRNPDDISNADSGKMP